MCHGIYRNLVPYIFGLSEVNRGKLHSICLLFPLLVTFWKRLLPFSIAKESRDKMYLDDQKLFYMMLLQDMVHLSCNVFSAFRESSVLQS